MQCMGSQTSKEFVRAVDSNLLRGAKTLSLYSGNEVRSYPSLDPLARH